MTKFQKYVLSRFRRHTKHTTHAMCLKWNAVFFINLHHCTFTSWWVDPLL